MKINITILIDNFIKRILNLENNKSSLEQKVIDINNLLDNLIDYCIKKKIYYYIENKIGYTKIVNNFKSHLITYILNLLNNNSNIISKYINDNIELDNYSDINSLLFNKFKNNINNHVSFRDNISLIENKDNSDTLFNYDDSGNNYFELNYEKKQNNKQNNNQDDNQDDNIDDKQDDNIYINELNDKTKLGLYIKMILSQNKYLIEFTDKLIEMCNITMNDDIEYDINNPYE